MLYLDKLQNTITTHGRANIARPHSKLHASSSFDQLECCCLLDTCQLEDDQLSSRRRPNEACAYTIALIFWLNHRTTFCFVSSYPFRGRWWLQRLNWPALPLDDRSFRGLSTKKPSSSQTLARCATPELSCYMGGISSRVFLLSG
jgi:hypothetical protein